MKIAFVGKGGSGKTTLSSLFVRHLAAQGQRVVAVDADINQHLGEALGLDEESLACAPQMGDHLDEIKEYLRGTNPLIPSVGAMIKSTPAGPGSRLLRVGGDDYIHWKLGWQADETVRLLSTGAFTKQDLGVSCYHSKTGAVELYLNHLLDGPDEYVVVDMTAGADAFASGLCAKFDMTFFVVEPTRKSVKVYQQYEEYAAHYGIRLCVVGNKVTGDDDVKFLREQVGDDLLTWIGQSAYVRAAEQGSFQPYGQAEPELRFALTCLYNAVADTPQDWEKFQRLGRVFHERNAVAWANSATDTDVTAQIDRDFVLSPALLTA